MPGINRKFFFDRVRTSPFGGSMSKAQVAGAEKILEYWEKSHQNQDDRWLAYLLGTTFHETDRKMQPIHEYGGRQYFEARYGIVANPKLAKRLGNLAVGDGAQFHGRGYVQLTGRSNYAYWEERLHADFTSDEAAADRVLEVENALVIAFEGMIEGTFTSKKLSDYFMTVREDWTGARAIINGTNMNAQIAGYGRAFYSAMSYTTA